MNKKTKTSFMEFSDRYYYEISSIKYCSVIKPKDNDLVLYNRKYLCFISTKKTMVCKGYSILVDSPISYYKENNHRNNNNASATTTTSSKDKSLSIASIKNSLLKRIFIFDRKYSETNENTDSNHHRKLSKEEIIDLFESQGENLKNISLFTIDKKNKIDCSRLWFK